MKPCFELCEVLHPVTTTTEQQQYFTLHIDPVLLKRQGFLVPLTPFSGQKT